MQHFFCQPPRVLRLQEMAAEDVKNLQLTGSAKALGQKLDAYEMLVESWLVRFR